MWPGWICSWLEVEGSALTSLPVCLCGDYLLPTHQWRWCLQKRQHVAWWCLSRAPSGSCPPTPILSLSPSRWPPGLDLSSLARSQFCRLLIRTFRLAHLLALLLPYFTFSTFFIHNLILSAEASPRHTELPLSHHFLFCLFTTFSAHSFPCFLFHTVSFPSNKMLFFSLTLLFVLNSPLLLPHSSSLLLNI